MTSRACYFFFLEEFVMVLLLNNEKVSMGSISYIRRDSFHPYINISTMLCISHQGMGCIIAFSSCMSKMRPLELLCWTLDIFNDVPVRSEVRTPLIDGFDDLLRVSFYFYLSCANFSSKNHCTSGCESFDHLNRSWIGDFLN